MRRCWLFLPAVILASCYVHRRSPEQVGPPEVTKGSACDGFAQVDPCAGAGLACTPNLADGGFTCELPGPLYACESSVGCVAPNLSCVSGTCLQSCKTTADCADPLTTCSSVGSAGAFCLVNPCGGPDSKGFWRACSAASGDGGDGTCIVLYQNPQGAPQGACQQGGTVPVGEACNFYRSDAGNAFCAPGLMCMIDASGSNSGVCLPACDPFTPGLGPGCAAGSSCVATTLPLPPPPVSYSDFYDETGACAQSCTPGDAGAKADAGDPAGDPPGDAGVDGGTDAGTTDAGLADAGTVVDAGTMVDAGTSGSLDAGKPVADAGVDAGTPASTTCAAPLTCQNGSLTSTPNFVCLP